MVRQNVVLDPTDFTIPAPLLLLLRRLRAGIGLIGGAGGRGRLSRGLLRIVGGSGSRFRTRTIAVSVTIPIPISLAVVTVERGRSRSGVQVQYRPLFEQLESRSIVPLKGFDFDEVPPQVLNVGRFSHGFRRRRGSFRERREIVVPMGAARFDDLLEELDGVLGGPDGFTPGLGEMGRRLLEPIGLLVRSVARGWTARALRSTRCVVTVVLLLLLLLSDSLEHSIRTAARYRWFDLGLEKVEIIVRKYYFKMSFKRILVKVA